MNVRTQRTQLPGRPGEIRNYRRKPSNLGRVNDTSGTKVINKITKISTAKKGSISLTILSIFSPEMLDATNNTNPIGGVAKPTVKFTHIMIAK
jgi:hypothetical protein